MHWRRQQGSRLRSRPPLHLGPEPHSTRSGPARPDPRPRQLSGLRGVGTPDPETFAEGRGREARTQGPGPARGVRPHSPRARARTARRVRGALPGPARKLAQNKSKSSGRRRGARWRGRTRADRAPRYSRHAGLAGLRRPSPARRNRGHRAPRRRRRVQIAACQGLQPRTHVRGARKPRRSAVRRPDIN